MKKLAMSLLVLGGTGLIKGQIGHDECRDLSRSCYCEHSNEYFTIPGCTCASPVFAFLCTRAPTLPPTAPTSQPTTSPTPSPSNRPTSQPTHAPAAAPTASPTWAPTSKPTLSPTSQPTMNPTHSPTTSPTSFPTGVPSHTPTPPPTASPTGVPTGSPTNRPTLTPSTSPTPLPTLTPTPTPTGGSTASERDGSPDSTGPPTPSPAAAPTGPGGDDELPLWGIFLIVALGVAVLMVLVLRLFRNHRRNTGSATFMDVEDAMVDDEIEGKCEGNRSANDTECSSNGTVGEGSEHEHEQNGISPQEQPAAGSNDLGAAEAEEPLTQNRGSIRISVAGQPDHSAGWAPPPIAESENDTDDSDAHDESGAPPEQLRQGAAGPSEESNVLISYSTKVDPELDGDERGKNLVLHIASLLKKNGISCYHGLMVPPGDVWWHQWFGRVESCTVAIVVLSPAYLARDQCIRELNALLGKKKELQIIPVVAGSGPEVDVAMQGNFLGNSESGIKQAAAIRTLLSTNWLPPPDTADGYRMECDQDDTLLIRAVRTKLSDPHRRLGTAL